MKMKVKIKSIAKGLFTKYLVLSLMLGLVLGLALSCAAEDPPGETPTPEVTLITINTSSPRTVVSSGEIVTIDISVPAGTWTYSDDADWCTPDQTTFYEGSSYSLSVTVGSNSSASSRSCTITFTSGELTRTFMITQESVNRITYTAGGISFNMQYVPGKGFFTGVSDSDGIERVDDGYYIAQTEVTYQLWQAVYNWATRDGTAGSSCTVDSSCQTTGENCYCFDNAGTQGNDGSQTDFHPVTIVNWYDVIKFSNALTEYYNATNGTGVDLTLVYGANAIQQGTIRTATGITLTNTTHILNTVTVNANATGFRLPSDAEWELAARFIDDLDDNGDITGAGEYYPGDYASGATADYNNVAATNLVAWSSNNAGSRTHEVGELAANGLGLFDMSGNVWEWTFSWYTPGSVRVARGRGLERQQQPLAGRQPQRQLPVLRGQ